MQKGKKIKKIKTSNTQKLELRKKEQFQIFFLIFFVSVPLLLDGKEYDIYVSYARNAEEEEFVLLTLRGVLENEFGYKLCIFDRDSLPGGSRCRA